MKFPQNFLAEVLTAGAGVLTARVGGEITEVSTALPPPSSSLASGHVQ